MPKTQIVHIHGGTPFDSQEQYESYIMRFYDPLREKKSWPEWIKESLNNEAEVFLPKMPAKDNAEYAIWKIVFEKMISLFTAENLIFTTRSLGTTFLTKYLSENIFPRPIKALHLVALVFDGDGIPDEGMADFIIDAEK
jgi:predicted alpha/beta hydrolase family esterase